jgi:hypothetical protein
MGFFGMLDFLTRVGLCGTAVAVTYAMCVLIIVVALCFADSDRRGDLLEALRILCRRRGEPAGASVSKPGASGDGDR